MCVRKVSGDEILSSRVDLEWEQYCEFNGGRKGKEREGEREI